MLEACLQQPQVGHEPAAEVGARDAAVPVGLARLGEGGQQLAQVDPGVSWSSISVVIVVGVALL